VNAASSVFGSGLSPTVCLSPAAPPNGVKKRLPQNTGVVSRNRWEGYGIRPGRWIGAALRLPGFEVPLRPKEPVKFCFSPHFTLLISGSQARFIPR
jgi:hypothetical protein